MGKMSQNEINVGLFDEVKRLKGELLEWETGQRQTSQDYNAYRQRGIQLYEKDQRIEELEKVLKEIVSYTKYEGNQWFENVKRVLGN